MWLKNGLGNPQQLYIDQERKGDLIEEKKTIEIIRIRIRPKEREEEKNHHRAGRRQENTD